jgi:hypothetical protein
MAQVFPLNVTDLSPDAGGSLAGTLAALPDPWTLLRHRRVGGGDELVEVVLVHPEIGVALVDEARDPAPSADGLRDYLDQQRFGEFFPGDLPIVSLRIAADEFESSGERLAAAFEAAPRLSIADGDWADAVIELLMVPDDLAMAPLGDSTPDATAIATEGEAAPRRAQAFDEPRPSPLFGEADGGRYDDRPRDRFGAVERESFDVPTRDPYDRPAAGGSGEPPLPLMVDWPFGASYERKRRRGRVAALAIIALLLAGAGFAAWEYAGEDLSLAQNDAASPGDNRADSPPPRSQIEVPLPSQSGSDQGAGKPSATSPPPVPPAPPVVMAQKPYAPPPPLAPKPTPVAPLPQIAAAPPAPQPAPSIAQSEPASSRSSPVTSPTPPSAAPPAPPAETAGAPPPPARAEPEQKTAATPPAKPVPTAAPGPAKPKPPQTRIVKAEPPPRPAPLPRREAPQESRPAAIENRDRPPIDAADLPPLDEPAPAPRPTQQAAAPYGSSEPRADSLGPPVPLWRAQASNAPPPPATAAVADKARECRPYTSSTTLTGRGLRVEGIACRGTDGQWRLVSEVPLH